MVDRSLRVVRYFSCQHLYYILLLLCLLLMARRLDARQLHQQKAGILVMAHGGSAEWNAAVEEAVAPLRRDFPLVVAFGMAERESLQQGVAELEAQEVNRIAIVRLFISGESFLHQTEYFLGVRQDPPAQFIQHHSHTAHHEHGGHEQSTPTPIKTASQIVVNRQGLVDFDDVQKIIRQRVEALSTTPAEESVLILAHGMGDEQENNRVLARMAALTRELGKSARFHAIQAETLREDWPDKRKLAEVRIREFVVRGKAFGGRVIVVPFRLFGFGDYDKVLEGLDYIADGKGLLPHSLITDWIRLQAEECFRRAGW